MKKRLLSLLLVLTMVLGMIPVSVSAETLPFTVTVDGQEMTRITESTLSWVDWSGIAVDVTCYTVAVPKGSAEATLNFEEEMQWSYYDSMGGYIGDGDTSWTPDTTHTVAVQDSNDDGELDGISVQDPSAFSTAYYILFVYEETQEPACLGISEDAPASARVSAGGLYKLNMQTVFTDSEDHALTYSYTITPEVENEHTKLVSEEFCFTSQDLGDYEVILSAECSDGEKTEHQLTLTVKEASQDLPIQYGYDETDKSTVTVHVNISSDGMPLGLEDGTVLAGLDVTKVEAVEVTVNRDNHVKVDIINAAGTVIAPVGGDEGVDIYHLVPGESYTWLSTVDTYYHATASFTAAAGRTVDAATPKDLQTVTVPLTGTVDDEIVISHGDETSVAQTYSIAVNKLPPIATTFAVTPSNAVIFLTEDATGTRIAPEADGSFILNTEASYTYVITAVGYVTKTGSFVAGQDNASITVSLTAAAASNLKDISISGDWLQFRADSNNNGVVGYKTPIKAEDAVLKIGEGYDSGATGCPIIVGGYLYTYAGKSIVKVNKDTGEVVASGVMAASSSFAINSPTYAEGMIFVALSGGKVQAFNAETLESLWLFTDSLGGQPNCPIIYCDGNVYTGFWNSETKAANFVCLNITDEDSSNTLETKVATWTYTHNGFYWAGAYANQDFVLIGTDDGDGGYTKGFASILSLDAKTGLLIDEKKLTNVGDQRSSICYDADTDAYYFTTKGGDFYQIRTEEDGSFKENSLRRLHLDNGADSETAPPMSTSTPVIYNGRAYIGVSGTGQFSAYSGHNMTVIDLETFSIAYTVATQGYPQTSGLLTTAYEDTDGYVYVYFIDNYTPGKLRVIRDKKGMTEVDHSYTTLETVTVNGVSQTIETGYVLFTPSGSEAQYAICSPIADAEGNLYFKNDSAYMMRLSSRITGLEITAQPEKLTYEPGMTFDGTGMTVTAHYANGLSKDITDCVIYTTDPLTAEDTEITLFFDPNKLFEKEDTAEGGFWKWYQNQDGKGGQTCYLPTGTVTIDLRPEHTPNEGVQTKAPTCTEDGELSYTCEICGQVFSTEDIPATGHSFENGTCGVCGEADPDYVKPIVQPVLNLSAPTLEFKDMIKVVAFFTAENIDDVVEMGMVTYTEQVDVIDIDTAAHVIPGAEYEASSGRYYASSQGIFANNKGFSLRKPAVSFEGAFSINYFFTPAYTPMDVITLYYWTEADFDAVEELTMENATGTIVMDGEGTSQYRGDITGIAAKNISQAVYVAAVYSDGTTNWTSGVLGYSIGAYCGSQATKGGTIAYLAMATAVYGYHAKQYFG